MNDFLQGKKSHSLSAAVSRPPTVQSTALPRIGMSPSSSEAAHSVAALPAAAAPAALCPGSKPVVDVIQTNGRVTQIVVTCSCGERIALDCLY